MEQLCNRQQRLASSANHHPVQRRRTSARGHLDDGLREHHPAGCSRQQGRAHATKDRRKVQDRQTADCVKLSSGAGAVAVQLFVTWSCTLLGTAQALRLEPSTCSKQAKCVLLPSALHLRGLSAQAVSSDSSIACCGTARVGALTHDYQRIQHGQAHINHDGTQRHSHLGECDRDTQLIIQLLVNTELSGVAREQNSLHIVRG